MIEGTTTQNHFNDFNSIIIDLKSLDVKIKDEDKAILLVVSLSPSYNYFKRIILYSNNDTLSFEDAKANLLSKESSILKFRLKKCEVLFVKGESKGCKFLAGGGVLKASKGTPTLLKALRHGTLYVLQGSIVTGFLIVATSASNDIFTQVRHIWLDYEEARLVQVIF